MPIFSQESNLWNICVVPKMLSRYQWFGVYGIVASESDGKAEAAKCNHKYCGLACQSNVHLHEYFSKPKLTWFMYDYIVQHYVLQCPIWVLYQRSQITDTLIAPLQIQLRLGPNCTWLFVVISSFIFQLTGQPVLIGGTMGTCSYVLTGTQEGMQATFGSTCHGAVSWVISLRN